MSKPSQQLCDKYLIIDRKRCFEMFTNDQFPPKRYSAPADSYSHTEKSLTSEINRFLSLFADD